MTNTFKFILVLLVFLNTTSCKDPENPIKPLPEYLIERFEPEGELDSISYMYLEFTDSSIYIADTMINIRRAAGFGGASIRVSLVDSSQNISYWLEIFSGKDDIPDNYDFLEIGSYHLYGWPWREEPDARNNGVAFGVSIDNIGNNSSGRNGYFYVLNKKGDDYKMTFRGTFDLELGNDYKGYTRVKGVYNITYIDSFF